MKLNFDELREKYGKEFVRELQKDIKLCKGDYKWKIEKFADTGLYTDFYFATAHDVTIYSIYMGNKRLSDRQRFTLVQAERGLKLMEEMWEEQYG